MRVFVMNMRGKPLMPCTQRKARLLLKDKKAKIVKYNPFTIQLNYATGETRQACAIGIDTGSEHIGIAVTSEGRVFFKGETELRQDIHSNIETRKALRRSRRNRKTRYRKARFLNRKRPSGWLPPSIQRRIDNTFRWIDAFMKLVPYPKLCIEVGKFDPAMIENPDITGEGYQHGKTFGYYDVRYYVFARDDYTCQVCHRKGGILHTHHIVYKSEGGTDKADNLITVCSECHTSENHKKGGILYQWMLKGKKVRQYKAPTFMNIIRRRIFNRYPAAQITYGSETVHKRKELGLEKTHYNDAIAISGINEITENGDEWLLIRQARTKKRSLHEANPRKGRNAPNTTQKRNRKNVKEFKGWKLNDKVRADGREGYITGFTSGGAYIKDEDGEYITRKGKTYKQYPLSQVRLLCHNGNWQYIRKAE